MNNRFDKFMFNIVYDKFKHSYEEYTGKEYKGSYSALYNALKEYICNTSYDISDPYNVMCYFIDYIRRQD